MIGNLIKRYHERLFYLQRENMIIQHSDLILKIMPITEENVSLVETLRGHKYVKQFYEQLAMGDFGYYACVDDHAVGYGWVKKNKSKDYFFDIGDECRYLCRFFVHEAMRGHRIYPELICSLIAHEEDSKDFYIAVEQGNESSERGLKKVGFEFQREFVFYRAMRRTLNKYRLTRR